MHKKTVDTAYAALCRLADRVHDGDRLLTKLVAVAAQQEREHRAFGKRLTNGQARYSESVMTAARYFACKWVTEDRRPPASWDEVVRYREDAVLGYALRDRIEAAGLDVAPVKAIEAVDYSEHIAIH